MHGGRSTGARSVDGKLRQAEGRERHLRRLRAQGRKPGPAKGTGGRPRKTARVDPVERLRVDALAALGPSLEEKRSTPMPDVPEQRRWRFIEQPVPSVSNPEPPLPAIASPAPDGERCRGDRGTGDGAHQGDTN
jgi:hypothetical protein